MSQSRLMSHLLSWTVESMTGLFGPARGRTPEEVVPLVLSAAGLDVLGEFQAREAGTHTHTHNPPLIFDEIL